MNQMIEIEMEKLIGEHFLSGVEVNAYPIQNIGEHFLDCNSISFILDGVVYTAIENPEDGYRCSMDKLIIDNIKIRNTFEPVKVLVRKSPSEHSDILDFVDIKNGKTILLVGTENIDDYYPCFVSNFLLENMSINEKESNGGGE